jgi:hypothetical protein
MTSPFTKSKSLEHHGLVAQFYKEIELAEIIDHALKSPESRKIL